MNDTNNYKGFFLIIMIMLALGIAIMVMIVKADAHEMYEYNCCGGEHCHPVKDGVVIETPDGGVDVRGFVEHIAPNNPKLRMSLDTEDHICDYINEWGAHTLYCVYHVRRGY